MSARPNITSRQRTPSHPPHSHAHATATPPIPVQRTASRPGTPAARGDIPSRKSSVVNLRQLASPSSSQRTLPLFAHPHPHGMVDQLATPTPRKSRRRGGKSSTSTQRRQQRPDDSEEVTVPNEPSSDDEESLFDLLGVISPLKGKTPAVERGMLSLPKDDMDQALGRHRGQGGPRRKNERSGLTDDGRKLENGDIGTPRAPDASPARGSAKGAKRSEVLNGGEDSVPDIPRGKGKRGKKAKDPAETAPTGDSTVSQSQGPSGLSTTRPSRSSHAAQSIPLRSSAAVLQATPFDVTSLSQSLPTGGLMQADLISHPRTNAQKKRAVGTESGDESAVWEMPEVAGEQELTWQQKLQGLSGPDSNNSSKRHSKSTPTDRKSKTRALAQSQAVPSTSSPLNPRPARRRLSLDGAVPTNSALASTSQAGNGPGAANVTARLSTFSAFDSHIPFHTGYNVHRAPQTPAKGVASAHGNLLKVDGDNGGTGGRDLPIVGSGEFPRIDGAAGGKQSQTQGQTKGRTQGQPQTMPFNPLSGAAGSGPKYAGPTFHNSPHAASLPKPDLEDF